MAAPKLGNLGHEFPKTEHKDKVSDPNNSETSQDERTRIEFPSPEEGKQGVGRKSPDTSDEFLTAEEDEEEDDEDVDLDSDTTQGSTDTDADSNPQTDSEDAEGIRTKRSGLRGLNE